MNSELELKIAERFPWMRPRRNTNQTDYIDDLYKAFGMECGDGWYELICNLCQEITDAYESRGLEVGVIPEQVKEKFGGLRFYISLSHPPKHKKHNMDKVVHDIISKYEDLSYETCECCGAKGETRGGGWIQTLCDECHNKQIERQKRIHDEYLAKREECSKNV